jgi:hypothetical protein
LTGPELEQLARATVESNPFAEPRGTRTHAWSQGATLCQEKGFSLKRRPVTFRNKILGLIRLSVGRGREISFVARK